MTRHEDGSQRAVALRYDGLGAPRVTAKGEDDLAQAILASADAHGIPIHQDTALLKLLTQVELDKEIPIQLFVAVAEVLAFAYALKGEVPPIPQAPSPGTVIDQGDDDIVQDSIRHA